MSATWHTAVKTIGEGCSIISITLKPAEIVAHQLLGCGTLGAFSGQTR